MTKGYIYALVEDNEIKYVGQTIVPMRRYSQHCSLAQNMGRNARQTWIRSLLETGRVPAIVSLEQTDDLDAAEIRWIKKLREQSNKLVNTADGGQDMAHTHRAKAEKPWGKGHSPVQKILMTQKQYIKHLKRYVKDDFRIMAEELRYQWMIETINAVGRDKMNHGLLAKYPERFSG